MLDDSVLTDHALDFKKTHLRPLAISNDIAGFSHPKSVGIYCLVTEALK